MGTEYKRYIYWVPAENIDDLKQGLKQDGYRFSVPMDSQCKEKTGSEKKPGQRAIVSNITRC